MALTEEQREIALRVAEGLSSVDSDYEVRVIERFLAALPKLDAFVFVDKDDIPEHSFVTARIWKNHISANQVALYHEAPIAQPASAPSEQKPILWAAYYGNKLKNVYRTKEKAEQLRLYNGLEKPVAVPLYLAPQPDYKAQRDALLEVAKKASEALDLAQSLLESAKSYHHKKVLNAYNETVAAIASVKGGA